MRRFSKNYRPKEDRTQTHQIDPNIIVGVEDQFDPQKVNKEWVDSFQGKIFFWSFTIRKVKPFHHASRFRISTHNFVPERKIVHAIEAAFPNGCRVNAHRGFRYTHTLDVKITNPMRHDEFIVTIVRAVEHLL